MSSQPQTRPETWVPAGTEKRGVGPGLRTEPQLTARKPAVALPPKEPRRPRRLRGIRSHVATALWVALAAGVPWLWFLIRDLGAAMQLIALALPVLVVVAFVGLAISALDERKLSSLVVAASIAAFGWVTIVGPRSAQPSPPPLDPVRIASITLDGSGLNTGATLGSLAKQRIDLAVVVEPSKKARNVLLRTDRFPFALASGRFVVLSSIPIHELALPKHLAPDRVIRLQVDRSEGAFVLYAVRSDGSPLDAALNDPIGIERLRVAAGDERLPVVLAGEFGIGDRSTAYRTLAEDFRDAMRSGIRAASTSATIPWSLLFVRTGYVLMSPAWCAGGGATFDVKDAQTIGLATTVGPCRG